MKIRSAAAIALAVATVAAPAADAAPKKKAPKKPPPVCNLVVDPTGDTFLVRAADGTANEPKENGLDIVSADIASDAKNVAVAIRVKALGAAVQSSPQGVGFSFDFLLPSSEMQGSLRAVFIQGQPAYYEATVKDPSVPNSPSTFLALAKGATDAKKNEIRIWAPVSVFSSLGTMKNGTVITPADDAATSGRAVPPSPGMAGQPVATRFVFADVAGDGKAYKVGTSSCVPIGK